MLNQGITSARLSVALTAWLVLMTAGPLMGQLTDHETQEAKDIISHDFEFFGRKSPLTLGSAFNALATFSPLDNPAGLAYTSDNHISFDLATTGAGTGHHLTFAAPNFALSSGDQRHDPIGEPSRMKSYFRLAYGLGFGSSGQSDGLSFALGTAINRKVDSVTIVTSAFFDSVQQNQVIGAQALTAEVGGIINLGRHRISIHVHDIVISGDKVYTARLVVGYSTVTIFGTRVAFQGMPGAGYGESGETALGFRLGVGQSFFDSRLDTRMQLNSFFDKGGEATMQNITGGIGYRLAPKKFSGLAAAIFDTEFSYTLSVLALPNINGAHLIGLIKYF